MQVKDTLISVVFGDITETDVDAIVNPANNEFKMGGGLAAIIKTKGGLAIEEEARLQGPVEVGESVITAAGNLEALYVIHASTMAMDFKTDEKIIRRATRSALECADANKITAVAFPALGCGVGRFCYQKAAEIMVDETVSFINAKPETTIKKIIFVMRLKEAYDVFEAKVSSF
ncbi:MAG: macro domain-containing protein [Candidatus Omnitrophica bacterium]|nr:macro domain-containing protein [Candidatus Omnitrophota bacterium]